MKILVIHKNSFNVEPPTQMVVQTLLDLGHSVDLVTYQINNDWRVKLDSRNVEIYSISNYSTRTGIFSKFFLWFSFRKLVSKIDFSLYDKIWIVNPDVFLACFGLNFPFEKIIFHALELFDFSLVYKHALIYFSKKTIDVVVPESNRASILKLWTKRQNMPMVLPNKPYNSNYNFDPCLIKNISPELNAALESTKKILLYQGHLSLDRDLSNLIKAAKDIPDFVTVLMGPDHGCLYKYREIDPTLIYIPRIDSPKHLLITSIATIGVLIYDDTCLNQIFCAPNKIFEFSLFSVPMIGNNIPGLSNVFDKYFAGTTFDDNNAKSICLAINAILDDYDSFSLGSGQIFHSIDNSSIINDILSARHYE